MLDENLAKILKQQVIKDNRAVITPTTRQENGSCHLRVLARQPNKTLLNNQ